MNKAAACRKVFVMNKGFVFVVIQVRLDELMSLHEERRGVHVLIRATWLKS